MYPTVLLLVAEHYGVSLPVEVAIQIIRGSRPVLPYKKELLLGLAEPPGKLQMERLYAARIYSMERAIQIAVLEMGLPCCPMYWYTRKNDPDALIPVEEAIAEPHLIQHTKVCSMTHEQRYSQAAYDLKVLTIEYMRKLVETPQSIYMGNLINFDLYWIKCQRKIIERFGTGRTARWPLDQRYQVDGFRVELDKSERENMYPSMYGHGGRYANSLWGGNVEASEKLCLDCPW